MSDTEDQSLFTVEYAKSGRAKCKLCVKNIEQGELRLGVKVQSSRIQHKITSWYHLDCFFVRQRPKGSFDISGFENVRSEDQKAIGDRLAGNKIPGLPEEVAEHVTDKEEKLKLRDYHVEYAKTGRSKCRKCVENIGKGEIRLSKRGYSPERAKMFGPQDRWYHVDCFVDSRDDLDFVEAVETIPGFDTLEAEDQQTLKEKLPDLQADLSEGSQVGRKNEREAEKEQKHKKISERKTESKKKKETETKEERKPQKIDEGKSESKKKKKETEEERKPQKIDEGEIESKKKKKETKQSQKQTGAVTSASISRRSLRAD